MIFLDYAYSIGDAVLQMPLHKTQKRQNLLKSTDGSAKFLQHYEDEYSSPVFNFYDITYVTKLYIGTPPQEFMVQLDTGSGDFWVVDSACGQNGCYKGCTSHNAQWCNAQCDPECCGQNGGVGTTTNATQPVPSVRPEAQFTGFRHAEMQEPRSCQNLSKFESQKSASYQVTNMTFSIEYGLGFAAGLIGQDFLQFASDSNATDGLRVCQAYFGQANQKDTQTPIFNGILGLALNTINQNVDPLFIQAYKQGLFKKPLFSLYLATQGAVNGTLGGVLTLGDVDDENCAPITDWIPITPNRFGLWEFQIDKVTLDDGTPINGTSDAVIDSGTSFLIGPFDEVNNISRHYGVDPENGTMPCDQKFGPIIFTIHGQEYKVDEKTLLFDMGDGTCFVGLITFRSLPFWLLGDPFCREYCQIHDVEKKQFALPKSKKEK
ncbi:hypothetical protein niasHT_011768 [Heterodera trifolii]|uniref:Peptidase A1 domain-containing protein n=1 Tax=Heterodera trifolii TaxID=157864 RepID=A0ABD2L619_9BILA